jgi:hypothetical protein
LASIAPSKSIAPQAAGRLVIAAPEAGSVSYGDVTVYRLPSSPPDPRGDLVFGEVCRHVPFEVKRFFLISAVPAGEARGQHAHRAQHHFLVCASGQCHVIADDGLTRREFLLDSPAVGLHVPPLIWDTQCEFSRDAVLLVLASGYYDPADYIRNYAEFRALRAHRALSQE